MKIFTLENIDQEILDNLQYKDYVAMLRRLKKELEAK